LVAFTFPFFHVSLAVFSDSVQQHTPSSSSEAVYAIAEILPMATKSL